MKNFWTKLNKPFFVLAPMDEVTEVVFREVVSKLSKPDVFFTEFTNVEGLNSPGREKLLERLRFSENQRPIVAQIWGLDPKNYFKTAKLLNKLGFDGIDINMGCPDRGIIKKGCCSALINHPKLAVEIIQATKKGGDGLPVSVKTRVGFSKVQTQEWITHLLKQDLAALTVHGRLVKDMSKVPADWAEIKKTVKIRNKLGVETLIIGNGDVKDKEDGLEKVEKYGVDGIMIGRGIFKDLFCFVNKEDKPVLALREMLMLLLEHAKLFDQTWGKNKNFLLLRKFFKIYVQAFEGANKLKMKLMETKNLAEVEKIVLSYLTKVNSENPRTSY